MNYRQRIAVEMLRRACIALAVVAVYLAATSVIALGLWWGFDVSVVDAIGIGLLIPLLLIVIGIIVFFLYDSSKDKIDTLDRTIMHGLGGRSYYDEDR